VATSPGTSPAASPLASPIAAIDVGSNTVHVTVARPATTAAGSISAASGRALEVIADQSDLVRLGHDIAATGAIGTARADKAIAALRRYVALARMLLATTVIGIATEGVRAASNSQEFIARAEAEVGVPLHRITGLQEAALSFWGATCDDPEAAGARGVVDLGGGSLELVVGEERTVAWRVSLPLGAGTVRDRFHLGDPPSVAELDRAFQAVRERLAGHGPPRPPHDLAVCGGTAGALAALGAHMFGESHQRVALRQGHLVAVDSRPILTRYHLETALAVLTKQPAARLAARHNLKPARARLLAAGSLVLLATMERMGVSRLQVSRRGIREGAIVAYLHTGERWLEAATRGRLR
jgi:exopolyphosphatase/guanosine-5'-triphosphate,3'-diphosphate pyrophosphatase